MVNPKPPEDREERLPDEWLNLIVHERLRQSLLAMSAFITAYEIFQASVIHSTKGFFVTETLTYGEKIRVKEYETEVRCLDKHEFKSCLRWVVSMGGLSDHEVDEIELARIYRNRLVHEVPAVISEGLSQEYVDRLDSLIRVHERYDQWWGENMLIVVDEDAQRQVDAGEMGRCESGSLLIIRNLIGAVFSGKES